MRIFKPMYKQDGKTKECGRFYLQFKDHNKQVRRYRGFASKSGTAELGKMIEKLIRYKISNMPLDVELLRFIEGTDPMLKKQFIKHGLLDAQRAEAGKSLKQHLAEFQQSILAKGNTTAYAELTYQRAKTVLIEKCGFVYISDIKASIVQNAVSGLQHDKKQMALSFQSQNFYLKACQQFCRWLVQDRRMADSPLQHLKGKNVRLDRHHDRRSLNVDELRRLLETTKAAPFRFGMSGTERALLYRLAAESGIRKNELRSLTVSSFDLPGHSVTVSAGDSKHRQEDRLPLRPDTADALAGFLCGKMPTVKVFNIPGKTAKMLKADLANAGIEYVVNGRYADFHALRHTTGSLLAAAGVHVKLIQTIMRHSDINLTMSRYTHIFAGQESDAVAALPDLSLPSESQRQVKTGTYNSAADLLCSKLAPKGGENEVNSGKCGQNMVKSEVAQNTTKPAFSASITHFQPENAKANDRIRTDNPRFTKPELYR